MSFLHRSYSQIAADVRGGDWHRLSVKNRLPTRHESATATFGKAMHSAEFRASASDGWVAIIRAIRFQHSGWSQDRDFGVEDNDERPFAR